MTPGVSAVPMDYQFSHHYSREEARRLLPEVRHWLGRLQQLLPLVRHQEERMAPELAHGEDLGGEGVDHLARLLAEVRQIRSRFRQHEIQVKDLDRGLVDFPALLAGREVFLCWEQGEEDIEFWRELDGGDAGRQPVG